VCAPSPVATTSGTSPGLWAAVAAQTLRVIQIQKGAGVARRCLRALLLTTSNPSIERTALSQLRWPKAAAHVER
jgi:hypothetical protein